MLDTHPRARAPGRRSDLLDVKDDGLIDMDVFQQAIRRTRSGVGDAE